MKLRELMRIQALQISSSAMLAEAAERMAVLGTDVLAVVEDRRVIGVVAQRDLEPQALPDDVDPGITPVRSVMAFGATCCSLEDDLGKAIEIIKTSHALRVIVLDSQGMAVGALSAEDLDSKAANRSHTRPLMEGEDHESPRD